MLQIEVCPSRHLVPRFLSWGVRGFLPYGEHAIGRYDYLSYCVQPLARNIEEPVHAFGYAQRVRDLVLDLAFNGLGFALSPESSGVFDV